MDSAPSSRSANEEHITRREVVSNYHVFGLHLLSNLPLPGVIPANSAADTCDVELRLGVSPYPAGENCIRSEEPTYASSETNAAGEPVLRITKIEPGAWVRLAYEDGMQFWLDQQRKNIWATWPESMTLEHAASYLLGPVLGLLLRLRGVTCLHASAVAFGDWSVAFVGPTGSGKSTTAAAFAREGYGILSDDIAALAEDEGVFRVMPAYPHLYLWPDSAKMLYGSAEALPRCIPDWEKRRLELGEQGLRFESRPLPLGAIYLLGDRRSDLAPYVENIRPQAALVSLLADTYANKTLDRDMRAREFAVLSQLVSTVRIRRVYPHQDSSRMEELCQVIRKDFKSPELPRPAQS